MQQVFSKSFLQALNLRHSGKVLSKVNLYEI